MSNPFSHPNPFDIMDKLRAAKKIVDYVTSDQEKEGREQGINAAANIYKPVLTKLEKRQAKIIALIDKEQIDFAEQAAQLKEECAEYEKKTADLADILKRKSSSNVDKFFDTVGRFGMFGGEDSIRGMGIVMYDSWSLADHLEKKMNEKRAKYYKEEFQSKSIEWQVKIKSVRVKLLETIKNFKNLKASNKNQLKYITSKIDEALEEYCETFAKYNALKEMENPNGQT